MTISRRRFMMIAAVAAAAPGRTFAGDAPMRRWSGTAMGARATLSISGLQQGEFNRLIGEVTAEIDRLENTFSLFRSDSELSRLNAKGTLDNPSGDFLRLLSTTGSIHRASGGVFDPTIQPVWRLLANSTGRPDRQSLDQALGLVGFNQVHIGGDRIRFARPGMAMTLNGIAQGYATDRVADLLRRRGLRNVLVSMGEISALGERAAGEPWRVGISETESGQPEEQANLIDRAIATSSPAGLYFDSAGTHGHIIEPRSGKPSNRWRRISVICQSATIADGLSTAFCAMTTRHIRDALGRFADTRFIAVSRDGERVTIQA